MSKITNDGRRHNPVWYRMLYSCTHMATVGVRGLMMLLTCSSWFHTWTFPLYKLTSIHGSFGCKSVHLTRSDLADNLRLISNLRG